MDSSGVNFIDCVKIYTRPKSLFGWPDDPPPPQPAPSKAESGGVAQAPEQEEESADTTMAVSVKSVSPADR